MTQWYEDVVLNELIPMGEHTFTAEEIVAFASDYDPHYFHTDPEAARQSVYGGLVASGWHTACVGQRLMIDRLAEEAEILRANGEEPGVTGPSPGINDMGFETPVRPGDTVTYSLKVTHKRRSNSLPGWGVLINFMEGHNQNGERVYYEEVVSFSKLRDYHPSRKQRFMMWLATIPGLKRLVRKH